VFDSWHALAANLAAAPTGNPEDVKALQAMPPKSMDDVAQVYGELLARFDANAPQQDPGAEAIRLVLRGENTPTNIDLADFDEIRGPGGDANLERALETAVRSWQAEFAYRGLPPRAMALEDSPHPITAHVFLRGNPNNLGVEAPPQFLTVLSKEQKRFEHGSGRLDLANAIVSDQNPLTARVIVNRVWQWHFGRGLVTSPSDFGLRGDPPTHPELLDYLSKRFMDEGWSLKKLHKWIMLSSAYQQSSEDRADAHAKDPENKLIWRMNRQRLDYESLRDGILSVAGQLDPTACGLPYSLTANPTIPRRTVYAYVERGRLPGEMNTFDFANPESHSPQRYQTTVPQQALFLMNSPFIAEEARHLMQRPEIAAARDDRSRVAKLYRAVLGRAATPDEIQLALAYIAQPAPPAPASPPASPWEYGMGSFNETTGAVSFEPFRYFVEDSWQPESLLPHPTVGSANLSAKGGTPGDDPQHAVTRRWTAPLDGTIDIKGTLSNKKAKDEAAYTVRARIVHSSQGKLAEKIITDKKEDLALSSIAVHAGDRIDFIVDFPGEPTNEIFTWVPEITMQEHVWNSAKDFRVPAPLTLTAWEKFAQVLLETNEFAFID
ncbi:MAG: Protein of unknown function (DUF1553)/Protein of unknown function (DUF1549)/Planctomycete, partial [Bryobacterales bacterium]|nr:Protein of unknown function (DUF1553)/Protein of unknown function (DUF1549)/Planctomycete [Bryobacterales bacterium]